MLILLWIVQNIYSIQKGRVIMLIQDLKQKFLEDLEMKNKSPQTFSGYEKDIRFFQQFLEGFINGQVYVEDITEEDIEEYIKYLRNTRGLQPRSQNRYISSIRSMYNYAFKKRIISVNVAQYIENVQYQRKERDFLNLKELELLFKCIDKELVKIAVMTLAYTGLRISELKELKLIDVDLINKTMKVTGRGDKQRIVPISDTLHDILQNYLKNLHPKNSAYFFATKKTGRLSSQYVNKVIRDSAKLAGISKQVSAHTLRHSFASHLIKSKVDVATLQRLLGHTNIRTTSVYLHTDYEQLKEAVNVW